MANINRQVTAPRKVHRSQRNHRIEHLSSLKPGVAHPIVFAPMLREDKCKGRVQFVVEMKETKEILANGVKARFSAYVVPWLAMERFQGSRDQFDRSWMGKPKTDDPGETVTPFFTKQPFGTHGSNALFKASGLHGKPADQVNTMYVEAYNLIYNYRARKKSKDLTARLLTETSLAPAFWHHTGFEHIVPDFDQAVKHGEVALNVVEARLAVRGIVGSSGNNYDTSPSVGWKDSAGKVAVQDGSWSDNLNAVDALFRIHGDDVTKTPNIYAEMGENSIVVSLANIKKAQQLQSWAEVRKRFEGHDDDDIIDMLMAGLTIDDMWAKQPILLDEDVVTFRQAKRYATTAGELIVLKTSRFRDEEADGILEALQEVGTELRDLVWVQESSHIKVLRDGNYPVMRGTFVELGGKGLLYTTGSIPYYGTYPGIYDPKPLLICPHPRSDSTVRSLAEEVFSLTKVNWNSTQMNQKLPIPIRAARNVGEILKYITDEKVNSDYGRYI